jgi:hypothetical protein
VTDPTVFLTEPGKPDDSISNGFVNPIDLFNYVSPSAWLNAAIEKLTGFDVFGWMTDWLSGDWEKFWKFGDAMANLAQCMQQIGVNIQNGVIRLDDSWDGNASDAAYSYFSDLAAATSAQQFAIAKTQESYHKAAQGAWQLSNQLGNLLQALADKAILAGIAAAAGTALIGTGIGAVTGYGAAGVIVLDMLNIINKASVIINTAGTVILGLLGAVVDAAYQGGGLDAVPLPATAYAGPGA